MYVPLRYFALFALTIRVTNCFIKNNANNKLNINFSFSRKSDASQLLNGKKESINMLRVNNTKTTDIQIDRTHKEIDNNDKIQICFVAGIGDTNGYGWGISKELSKRNVKLILGVWPPVYNIFMKNYKNGKFDKDMVIDNNKKMEILDILPFDASFDTYEDIDQETKNNKRYNNLKNYSISEVSNLIYNKYGNIDMLVHSLANGREVQKTLLDTSREGYLDALSKSSYSLISLCKHFCKIMNPESSIISLTYQASQKVVPGYGGGMSSAKAALESDTRFLAYYLGRKYKIRVNTISAGPLKSRAASAINKVSSTNMNSSGENDKENYSFIDYAIDYSEKYSPLQQKLTSTDVGSVAAFLLSKESRAVTGQTIYVDNGLNIMYGPDDLFQTENN